MVHTVVLDYTRSLNQILDKTFPSNFEEIPFEDENIECEIMKQEMRLKCLSNFIYDATLKKYNILIINIYKIYSKLIVLLYKQHSLYSWNSDIILLQI